MACHGGMRTRISELRPHHRLDIVTDYSPPAGPPPQPAPGENGVRAVTWALAQSLDEEAAFVVGPDDICRPCSHLLPNGRCDRILQRHDPPQPMDEYNDPLDRRILEFLGLAPGARMTLRRFLALVNDKTPGIEEVCTHPTKERAARRNGLIEGLMALGLRQPASGSTHASRRRARPAGPQQCDSPRVRSLRFP
jgi:hypothetical protein